MESQPILFHLMLKQGFNWFTLTSKDVEIENVYKDQFNIVEMAREISPICHFISGSIMTCLLTDMVDIDLTIRTVKGIYTYRKDNTTKSMIFTPWSKKVIPFPSLRWKIQAFQDDKRQNMKTPWNDGNTVQFSPSQDAKKSEKVNHWQN